MYQVERIIYNLMAFYYKKGKLYFQYIIVINENNNNYYNLYIKINQKENKYKNNSSYGDKTMIMMK